MQSRMKEHPLAEKDIAELLATETVGRLSTLGQDGFPYTVPVHFIWLDGQVYIHGLAAGEKLRNIRANPHVCFEVDRMQGLIHAPEPCDTNTAYQSVIIRGTAREVDATPEKIAALNAIVNKYTPQHEDGAYPDRMLKMTAVIAIAGERCTGKFYPAA